jgi:hypothetical protein
MICEYISVMRVGLRLLADDFSKVGFCRGLYRYFKVRVIWFCKRRREDPLGFWRANYWLKKSKTNRDCFNYLRGKRVAIVGPAPHMRGSSQAALIDSYDVVVRLNTALPIPTDRQSDVGVRTDILYHVLDEESGRDIRPLVDGWGLRFIVNSYPDIRWYIANTLRMYKAKCCTPLRSMSKPVWRQVFSAVRSTPNTGLLGMAELLASDIDELYITGFSFYKGGCDPSYRQESEDEYFDRLKKTFYLSELFHDQGAQFDYFREHIASDPRVVLDSYLQDICG